MKITNIFESIVRDEPSLYDPRHLYEDFKREQQAIEKLMEAPSFAMPNIKPAKKKGGDDMRNPSAGRKGGKLGGRERGAGIDQEAQAKRDSKAKDYTGEFSGEQRAPERMSQMGRDEDVVTHAAGGKGTGGASNVIKGRVQKQAQKDASEKGKADQERKARREATSTYNPDGDSAGTEIKGDTHLSSASKKWNNRDGETVEKDPGADALTDIESEEGKAEESGARLASSSGEYTRKFQKQRSAHAKERGVPELGGSEEDKNEINNLATTAKGKQRDSFQKDGEAIAQAVNTGKDISAETDSQAMTDLYDASLKFLISAASKVLSKAGVTGAQQTSLLDDAFQESSRLWFDSVKKYKMSDGDFENFMRSHVASGVKNWAQEELKGGAPNSRYATAQAARLNKIKAQLQQNDDGEVDLNLAAEMWNQEEDQMADEKEGYKPRHTTAEKLRKIETQATGWGSTDDTIEGSEGEEVAVGSTVAGGDSGEIYGQSGASEQGGIGIGSSPEEDMEKMEREVQSGGSGEGLAQLGQALQGAGIEGDQLEAFSMLWGLGGDEPMSEKDVGEQLGISRQSMSTLKKQTTAKLVKYLRDTVGWEEAEIRNYLEDIFDERQQTYNLATNPSFEASKKKEGGDVLTPAAKVATKKLQTMRDKRAEKKGAARSAERKARQQELMPQKEFGPTGSGMSDDFTDTKGDAMQGGAIGAENHKILQKRYGQVEKALGRLGDDATEQDIDKWYDKANKYLGSTLGLEPLPGGDGPLPKEVVDTASQEFKDRLDQVRADKIADLAKEKSEQIGQDLTPEEYLDRRTASLARKGNKGKTVDKNEGRRGNLDYKPFQAKDAKKQGYKNSEEHPDFGKKGTDMKKDRRIKSMMDTLGLSKEEATAKFDQKFPDHKDTEPKKGE